MGAKGLAPLVSSFARFSVILLHLNMHVFQRHFYAVSYSQMVSLSAEAYFTVLCFVMRVTLVIRNTAHCYVLEIF